MHVSRIKPGSSWRPGASGTRVTSALVLVAMAAAAGHAQAQVPVLRGDRLHLDAVASVAAEGNGYFRNLVLQRDGAGTFHVAAASARALVDIHDVRVHVFDTDRIEASVTITGITSVACVGLEPPAQTRTDTTFHVVLAESAMPPGSTCASLLPNAPFELSLPLDIHGLPAGSYTVNVNGVTAAFVLETP